MMTILFYILATAVVKQCGYVEFAPGMCRADYIIDATQHVTQIEKCESYA
jgi:hypothetical protein